MMNGEMLDRLHIFVVGLRLLLVNGSEQRYNIYM